jgi:DNA repair ATPase RecN
MDNKLKNIIKKDIHEWIAFNPDFEKFREKVYTDKNAYCYKLNNNMVEQINNLVNIIEEDYDKEDHHSSEENDESLKVIQNSITEINTKIRYIQDNITTLKKRTDYHYELIDKTDERINRLK